MKTPDEIKRALLKKWNNGRFFDISPEAFPLRVPTGRIPAANSEEQYNKIRKWVSLYSQSEKYPFRIEWQEKNHRLWGKNRIPTALIFNDIAALTRFLGKAKEWERFIHLKEMLIKEDEQLSLWIGKNPFLLLENQNDLNRLISLWRWMIENPRPEIYLRQIDLPEIDTKFTEKYRKLLDGWLELTLPPEVIDNRYSGTRQFEEKYGFLKKPKLIRFRILDSRYFRDGCSDITLPASDFCKLYTNKVCPFKTVIIIENDITALAFPERKNTMLVFGRGYHFSHWKDADWLQERELLYWGDIDTHGFRILSEFRSLFPQTHSLMMDKDTLMAHSTSWGKEAQPFIADIPFLTQGEQDVFDDLRFNRIEKKLRLEQEFVRFGFMMEQLAGISGQ